MAHLLVVLLVLPYKGTIAETLGHLQHPVRRKISNSFAMVKA
jgi:hypothetical protein